MDFFDVAILKALGSKENVEFHEILSHVNFSHNTLREHLYKLVEQRLVERINNFKTGNRLMHVFLFLLTIVY